MSVPGWEVVSLAVCTVLDLSASWSGQADAAVITSRHAARWFVRNCRRFEGVVVAAGPATARILEEDGVACIVPARQGGKAALDELQAVPGARILFPCGETTAGTVEARALELGLGLERLPVYRLGKIDSLAVPGSFDAVAFWSGQMVVFFKDAVGESRWDRIRRLPVLCLEGTSREALRSHGWQGEIIVLEKTPLQEELSSILLGLVTSCGLTGDRSGKHPGQGAEGFPGVLDFRG